MLRIIHSCILIFMTFEASGQVQVPVPADSKVEFRIKNFGFGVTGKFSGLSGKIVFDHRSPSTGSMDVSVDAATIDTDNNTRDGHLKKEDYFDVKNYPKIRFVSTRITNSGKNGEYIVSGKLTIKKTTREVSFPFTAKTLAAGYLLKGDFKINRRDFGVGGSSTVSDNLLVCLLVATRRS
jgi:polyisoprenoid-binding protein YceI